MSTIRTNLVVTLLLTAIVGGAGFVYLALNDQNRSPAYATVLPTAQSLPPFDLIDENGNVFGREALRGTWSLLFFGFTHCPDICPATLQQLSLARARLQDAGGEGLLQIVLVSVDPERDTPAALKAYTSHFAADITSITGNIEELKKLTSATGVYFAKSAITEDGYNIDHSAVILVINPDAEFHALFSAPYTVDQLVADIPLITDSS